MDEYQSHGAAAVPPERRAQTPRLRVRRAALLCTDAIECAAALCDLSLGGAGIETDEMLWDDSEVAIFVDGLLPLSGRVRWCRDRHAGVQFHIPMRIDVLADWFGTDGGTATTR